MLNKYIYHEPKENHLVGIMHLKKNLFSLMMEAKFLNRIAIIPPLHLSPKHNNDVPVIANWDKYILLNKLNLFNPIVSLEDYGEIDYRKCKLIDENIQPNQIIHESNQMIVRKHNQYPNYYILINFFANKNWKIKLINLFQPSKLVAKYAKIAISKMENYHCIHIRRGDKLKWKQCPGLDRKTRPEYIKKFLINILPKGETIYIMSNEKEPNFFDLLKNSYNLITYKDFPEFIQIGSVDNYLLFSIENEIMKNATTKVRTFKENGHLSLLNYPPDGVELLSSKIRRRMRFIFKKINNFLSIL